MRLCSLKNLGKIKVATDDFSVNCQCPNLFVYYYYLLFSIEFDYRYLSSLKHL